MLTACAFLKAWVRLIEDPSLPSTFFQLFFKLSISIKSSLGVFQFKHFLYKELVNNQVRNL